MTTFVAVCVAAVALLVAVVLGVLWARDRRRTARVLAAGRADAAELRERLDALSLRVDAGRAVGADSPGTAEFVITDVGTPAARAAERVPDRVVVSAALGEPLVKAAALGHGVRRALDARTRNRIWFEMKQQVRAARKQRRREVRAHLRDLRTGQARAEVANDTNDAA